ILKIRQKTSSSYKQSLMENALKKFAVREGDFMTLLNVFNSFKKRPKDSNWCRSLYLNHSALKRALKIRKQILRIAKKLNLKIASSCGEVEPILKAIINGFSRNAAKLQNDGSFKSVNSKETKLMLHPHSVLSGSAPGWVVFDEIISVDQNYMLNVSVLEPKWLIES
ncbi:ATP-dependent RNA helicase, partial [Bonamia ostreae]